MYLDAQSVLSNNQAITSTAASSSVYDITGAGLGNPSPNTFGQTFGTATSQGQDLGGGGPLNSPPVFVVMSGTAFATSNSATLQIQFQAAVDTNNTGTPGTWDTIVETDAYAASVLTANRFLARFVVPPRVPGQNFPRFYRINYNVGTGVFTAGTILFAGLATGFDTGALYSGNF